MKFRLRLQTKRSIVLVVATSFLLLVGILIQFSLKASDRSGLVASPQGHVLSIVIGMVALLIALQLPLHIWQRWAVGLYLLAIGLLLLVRRTGPVVFGAKRWLLIGNFQIQPSELIKPVLALLTAGYLTQITESHHQNRVLIRLLLIVSLPVILVLAQPDVGTSLVLIGLWSVQVVVAGLPARQLASMAIILVAATAFSLPLMSGYQRHRLESFVSGRRDEDAISYNVVQARIAIGSGGLLGQGLNGGTQSQLSFLPARHTDFVFAVVAEKLGLVGALAVIFAEAVVIGSSWRIVRAASSQMLGVLAAGLAAVFMIQAIVNSAMNVGLLPVTGIPLPFMSYGGTSMVVSLFMVGWLLKIDMTKSKRELFTGRTTSVILQPDIRKKVRREKS